MFVASDPLWRTLIPLEWQTHPRNIWLNDNECHLQINNTHHKKAKLGTTQTTLVRWYRRMMNTTLRSYHGEHG